MATEAMGGIEKEDVKSRLKYPGGVPIAPLSRDNGGWQPRNANRQMAKALTIRP